MRTTLSLDDDVAAMLKGIQERSGRSWKDTVNDAARAGAIALARQPSEVADVPLTVGVDLGAPYVADVSNVHELLSLVEGNARP